LGENFPNNKVKNQKKQTVKIFFATKALKAGSFRRKHSIFMKKTVLNLFVALLVIAFTACFDKKEQSETRPLKEKSYTFRDSSVYYTIVKITGEDCNSSYWQNFWFYRTDTILCGNDIFYYRPVDLSDFAKKYAYTPKVNDWLKIRYAFLKTDSTACESLKYLYEDIYVFDYQVLGNFVNTPGKYLVKGTAVKTSCSSIFGNNLAFAVDIPVKRNNELCFEKCLFYPFFKPDDVSEPIREGDEYNFMFGNYSPKKDCNDGNKAFIGVFSHLKKAN
jgi:hypothetical protein